MTIRVEGDLVILEGRCSAEDAETLLIAFQDRPDLAVDASGLSRLHLAVAQVLLTLRPSIHARPAHDLLTRTVFDIL